MQPALIQHDLGCLVEVFDHRVRKKGFFTWVLRHHINEGLGIHSEGFSIRSDIIGRFNKALFHFAHLAADLVALLLVDLGR